MLQILKENSIKQQSFNNKHIPQRTCIACKETNAKKALARLVLMASGEVEFDRTGKKPGRGAYLCYKKGCWQMGLRKGGLEHTLRTTLTPENRRILVRNLNELYSERESQTDQ